MTITQGRPPVEEASVEEASVEEAPVEEAPVEEAPVEEALVPILVAPCCLVVVVARLVAGRVIEVKCVWRREQQQLSALLVLLSNSMQYMCVICVVLHAWHIGLLLQNCT